MAKFKVGDVVSDIDGLFGNVPGKIVYIANEDLTGYGKFLVEFPSDMADGWQGFWRAEYGASFWNEDLSDDALNFLKSCPKETGYLWREEESLELYAGGVVDEEDRGGLKYL